MQKVIDKLEFGGGVSGADSAIADAAYHFGCEVEYLKAIIKVESNGKPFDDKGRLTILPEKHVFWRELPKNLRGKAKRLGLATAKWSKDNYKGLGKIGSDARWKRLRAMTELHETAGLRSASYGGPQIMAFNHKLCGYSTVTDFVLAMAKSETNQIDAFVGYLESVGLAEALRSKDTRFLTRRYNGPGQVEKYSAMIDRAYRGLTGNKVKTEVKRSKMLRLGSEGDGVAILQRKLVKLGYHCVVDGDFGPATQHAVVAFQKDHGLEPDGLVGSKTRRRLEQAVPRNLQPGGTRENLTVADLRKRGSQTVKQSDRITYGSIIAMVFGSTAELAEIEAKSGLLGFASEAAGRIQTTAEPLLKIAQGNTGLAVIVFGGLGLLIAHKIKQRRLQDAKEWRHVG